MAPASPQKRSSSYTPMFVQKKERNVQLPALNIPSSSLTEGTNIPAPADSPTEARAGATASDSASRPAARPDTGSTPQTPLALESPAPLRSHPTSSHDLSRQYQLDAPGSPNGTHPPSSDGKNGALRAAPTAYGSRQPQSPRGNGHAYSPAASNTAEPSYTYSVGGGGGSDPTPFDRYPPKRQPTSESISPPPKRPLSVRKFLGIRALSAAFGRSSSVRASDQQHTNDQETYHKRNRSSDMLSLFGRRPESRQSTAQQPSLKKRRSSLMLLGRRGSAFFGLTVDEEPESDANQLGTDMGSERITREYPRDSYDSQETQRLQAQQGPPPPPPRKTTPPPTLPAIGTLRGNRGLHELPGGFMNGEAMFRDIE